MQISWCQSIERCCLLCRCPVHRLRELEPEFQMFSLRMNLLVVPTETEVAGRSVCPFPFSLRWVIISENLTFSILSFGMVDFTFHPTQYTLRQYLSQSHYPIPIIRVLLSKYDPKTPPSRRLHSLAVNARLVLLNAGSSVRQSDVCHEGSSKRHSHHDGELQSGIYCSELINTPITDFFSSQVQHFNARPDQNAERLYPVRRTNGCRIPR